MTVYEILLPTTLSEAFSPGMIVGFGIAVAAFWSRSRRKPAAQETVSPGEPAAGDPDGMDAVTLPGMQYCPAQMRALAPDSRRMCRRVLGKIIARSSDVGRSRESSI